MTPLGWPCPLPAGGTIEEYALSFDQNRAQRLLIVPALFDEANKLRRLTVEVMRRLDAAGIDGFLTDLPGCGESPRLVADVTPDDWMLAMEAAAAHFGATHLLAIRGGALIAPRNLPGWHYAPVKGASILRQLLWARILTAREAGREETQSHLLAQGEKDGLELAGYALSPESLRQLQALVPEEKPAISLIDQDMFDASPLWLRAEPSEDRATADALAAIIAVGMSA